MFGRGYTRYRQRLDISQKVSPDYSKFILVEKKGYLEINECHSTLLTGLR